MKNAASKEGNDPLLNLVMQASIIVWRLRNAPRTTDLTQLHAFHQNGKYSKITQIEIIDYLRSTANLIGEERLGFDPREIGKKSSRNSIAM